MGAHTIQSPRAKAGRPARQRPRTPARSTQPTRHRSTSGSQRDSTTLSGEAREEQKARRNTLQRVDKDPARWSSTWKEVRDDFVRDPEGYRDYARHLLRDPGALGEDRARVVEQMTAWAREGDHRALEALKDFVPSATGAEARGLDEALRHAENHAPDERSRRAAIIARGTYSQSLTSSPTDSPAAVARLEDHLLNGPELRDFERDGAVRRLIEAARSTEHGDKAVGALQQTLDAYRDRLSPQEYERFRNGVLLNLRDQVQSDPSRFRGLAHHMADARSIAMDHSTRSMVLDELARRGTEQSDLGAMRQLGGLLDHHDPTQRREVYSRLIRAATSDTPRAQEAALEIMRGAAEEGSTGQHRQEALQALLASPEGLRAEDVEFLSGRLGNLESRERAGALRNLGRASERLFPSLRLLSAPDERARDAFRGALRQGLKAGGEERAAALETMKDQSHLLRREDYQALSGNLTGQGAELLRGALEDGRLRDRDLVGWLARGELSAEARRLLGEHAGALSADSLRALEGRAPRELMQSVFSDRARTPEERAVAARDLARGNELPEGVSLTDLEQVAEASGDPRLQSEVYRHRQMAYQRTRVEMLRGLEGRLREMGPLNREEHRGQITEILALRRAILEATDTSKLRDLKNPPDAERDPVARMVWEVVYSTGKSTLGNVVENTPVTARGLRGNAASAIRNFVAGEIMSKALGDSPPAELAKTLVDHILSTGGRIASRAGIIGLVLDGYIQGVVQGVEAIGQLHNTVNQAELTQYLAGRVRGNSATMPAEAREFLSDHRAALEKLTGETMPSGQGLADYADRHAAAILTAFGLAGHAADAVAFGRNGTDYDPIPGMARGLLLDQLSRDIELHQDRAAMWER